MKSTIRVCVVYSRDLAGMPMVTHGSVNFREPQPGSEYLQTAKTAINGRRVNIDVIQYCFKCLHDKVKIAVIFFTTLRLFCWV